MPSSGSPGSRGEKARRSLLTLKRGPTCTKPAFSRVKKRSSGRGGGPPTRTPWRSYTPPWQGQMKRSEAGTQRTGQPRCAQRLVIAIQRLYLGGGGVYI